MENRASHRLFEELLHPVGFGCFHICTLASYMTLKYCAQLGGRFFDYRGVPCGCIASYFGFLL